MIWGAQIGPLGTIRQKQTLRKHSESHEHTGTASKGEYNLTTKARRKVVGGNKQLDEGVGRQLGNASIR